MGGIDEFRAGALELGSAGIAHDIGQSKRSRTPAQIARGAAGPTAFSLLQSAGFVRKEPFGLNELEVKNPAVAKRILESSRCRRRRHRHR